MKNHVQPGNYITVPAPAGGVISGGGVLINALFGIAAYTAAADEEVEIAVVGVYDLPKADTITFAVGSKVYWNDTDKNVTSTASGNKLIGVATKAVSGADTSVPVRLDGTSI
jgi:predicted RecA/RadA family phage recombinase